MILFDTDTLTLHQYGHAGIAARTRAASEIPAITVVTQIEAIRGRHDAICKAEDGARLLVAQEGLIRTVRHLALFATISFDEAAAAEFERLSRIKGLRKIRRGDLLIASIVLANKATLVTRNTKDFQKVPGLRLENWAD